MSTCTFFSCTRLVWSMQGAVGCCLTGSLSRKHLTSQKVLTLGECTPRIFLSKQKQQEGTFLWRSCCFIREPAHATKAPTHLDGPTQRTEPNWRRDVRLRREAANCCLTDQSASPPGPPESHQGSTFLFAALINKNSRSHPVLLCQNLHGVWGGSSTRKRQRSDRVCPRHRDRQTVLSKLQKCTTQSCTHGDAIISCCYRDSVCK